MLLSLPNISSNGAVGPIKEMTKKILLYDDFYDKNSCPEKPRLTANQSLCVDDRAAVRQQLCSSAIESSVDG